MKKRILTAVITLPLLLAVLLFLPPVWTAILLSLLSAVAAFELLWGTGEVRQPRLIIYTVIAAVIVSAWCYCGMHFALGFAGVLVFMGLLFAELLISRAQIHFTKVMLCVAGGIMLPFLFTSILRIRMLPLGEYLVFLPFVLAFASDTGAYFIGIRFGKHKLAPSISPNKTVEGAVGGVLFAFIGAFAFGLVLEFGFHIHVNYVYTVIYGLMGSVGSVFGDLAFSAIKRQTGIKDFGKIIPGHGGVLDRFDSMTVVAPVTEVLLILIPIVEMV